MNCPSCKNTVEPHWKACPICLTPVGSSGSEPSPAPDILGYCVGGGAAIRVSDPHFKCLSCGNLYLEKFRFQDHPVCETCAYKDGTAQQLEKELSAQREAEAVNTPHVCPVTGMEFVLVPEGEFQMGDVWGDGYDDEKPTHSVTVPAFQMGKYPVTQGQWLEVIGGDNPAIFSGDKFVHPDKPVITVSWDEAQEFIQRLNRKSGCNYRLPSEAEWEYAARSGGRRDKYSRTSNESSLSVYAHFDQDWDKGSTKRVGQKRPNDLDLYDMSGNVWEWCQDRWHDNYHNAPCNGSPWSSGGNFSGRVARGGSWNYSSSYCRVACRNRNDRGSRSCYLGFRLAL